MKIATSFDKYKKNNSLPDIYGYLDIPSSNYRTDMIYISYLKDFDNYPAKSLNMDEFTQVDLINKEYNSRNRYNIPYDELRQLILDNGMTALFTSIPYNSPDRIIKSNCAIMNSPLAKDGNNSIIEGVSSDVIDGLNEIPGIVSIDYSIFESERTWYWDNQDYHKMGIDKIIAAQKASSIAKTMKDPTYGSRYLFATEYVNPTKEIYDIASKYIDKSNINYDDFASGKQVIVFIQDNCEGDYDDTLKAGDTLYYNYYNSESLQSCWRDKDGNDIGFVVVGKVTWETCAYVARYIMKKQKGQGADIYEKFNIEPEFCLMSRKPGIAHQYYEDHPEMWDYDKINISTPNGGRSFRPPQYFERLFDVDCPDLSSARKKKKNEAAKSAEKIKKKLTDKSYSDIMITEENVKRNRTKKLRRIL
jgi:hypothetical protein